MVKSQKPDLAFQKQTETLSLDSVILERLWHMIPDDARLENNVLSTSGFSSKTMSESAYLISTDDQECERRVANAGKKLVHFLFPDTTFELSSNDEGVLVKSTKQTINPKRTMTSHIHNGEAVFDERTGFYNLFSDKEKEVATFLQVFQARLALAVTKEDSIAEVKEFQRVTHLPFEVLEHFYEKVKHRDIFQDLPPTPELNNEKVDGEFCYNASRDFINDVKSRRFGYGFKADDESLFFKIPEKILNGILVEGAEVALRRQKEKLEHRLKTAELWPSMMYGTAIDTERISSDDKVIDFFHELNTGIDFLMHMTPDYRLEEAYEFKKRLLVEEYKKLCKQVTMSPLIFTHYVHSYIYFCYLTHDRDALKEMVSVYLDIFQQNRIIEKHEWSKIYQGAARNLFEADVWDSEDLDLVKTLLFSWNALKEVNKLHELLNKKNDKTGSNTEERTDGNSHYNNEEKDALVERIRKVVINDIIHDDILKKLPSVFEKGTIELDNFDYLFVLSPLLATLGDSELDYSVLEAIARQADKHPHKLLMAEMYASNILSRYFYLPNEPTKQVNSNESPLSILSDITSPKKRLTTEQLIYWQQRFIDLFKPIADKDAANPNGFKSSIDKAEERSKLEAKDKNKDYGDTNYDARNMYHTWGGGFLGDYVYYHENQRRYAQAHLGLYDILSARRHFAVLGEKKDYDCLTSDLLKDLVGENKNPLSKRKILNLIKSCEVLRGLAFGYRDLAQEWYKDGTDNYLWVPESAFRLKYEATFRFSRYITEKRESNEEIDEEVFEKIMQYASRFYDETLLLEGAAYLLSRNHDLFSWLRDFWPNFINLSFSKDNEDVLCIDEMCNEDIDIDGDITKIVSKLKEEAVAFIEKKDYASAHMIYRKINPKKGNQEFLREIYSRNLQEVRRDNEKDGTIGLTFVDDKGKETKIILRTESLAGFGSIGVAKHSIIVNHDGEYKQGRRVIVTKINDDEKITAIEHKIYNELRHTNVFNVAKPLAVNGREIVVEYSGQTLVEYAQKFMQELARNTNNTNNTNHDYNPDKGNNPNHSMNRYISYLANAIYQKININKLLSTLLSNEDKAYLEERRIKKVLDHFQGRYSEREINEQYHAFRVMRAFGFDDELFRTAYTRTIGKALSAIPEKYKSWLKDSYGANFAVNDNENFTISNNGSKDSNEKAGEQEADKRGNRVIVFDFNNLTYDASQLDDSIFIHTYGLGLTEKGEEALLNECMQVMKLEEQEFGDVTDKRCEYKRGFIPASVHRNLLLAGNIMRAVESGRAPQERLADVNHHIERSMHYITQFVKTLGSEYNVDKEEVCYIIKTVNAMCMAYFERIEHRKTHRESINREESAQCIVSGDNLNNLGNSRISSVGNLESSLGFSE